MKKKIVILMSTYNGAKYVSEQLDSIINQDVEAELQILIRDDGSKDDTLAIVQSYKKMISIGIIDDGINMGPGMSFWTLLKNAPNADYYAFADQDDYWHSDKLAKALEMLSEREDASLYFSNSELVDGELKSLRENVYNNELDMTIKSQLICGTCQGCTMVFNHKCREMILSFNINKIIMHDIMIMLYSIACANVIYDNQPRLCYRQHEDNVESPINKSIVSRLKQSYKRWIKNKGIISEVSAELINNCCASMTKDDYEFCYSLTKYKKSFTSKIYLLKNIYKKSCSRKAERSFLIRLILNLL